MARVSFKGVWVNLVADPSQRMVLRTVPQFERVPTKQGRVVRGAGGLTRVIQRRGRAVPWRLSAHLVPREAADWIEEHVGDLVCLRDSRGHKVFGTYFSAPLRETNQLATVSLDLTVEEITSYTEEV